MTLRTRIWLVVGGLFMVPLLVAGVVLTLVVPDARTERVVGSVQTAGVAVASMLADECRRLGQVGTVTAWSSAASTPEQAVRRAVDDGTVDYAAVLSDGGTVVAAAGRLPSGSAPAAELTSCAQVRAAGALVVERVELAEAVVVVTRQLTADALGTLCDRAGTLGEVLLLRGDEVVATTLDRGAARRLVAEVDRRTGIVDLDGWTARVDRPAAGVPWTVVVAEPDLASSSLAPVLIVLVLVAAAVAAGLVVTVVARNVSQPFADLTVAAERVASGDLDVGISSSADGEAGRLGSALNQVTDDLRRSRDALVRSSEALHHSLDRIGEALKSTHDLDGLLWVVLETATATVRSGTGVVLYRSADRVQLVAEQGLRDAGHLAPTLVIPGRGVLGRVLSTGKPVRGRIGSGPVELAAAETEPQRGDVLAVPLHSMGAVVGVVALYDRADGQPFDEGDEQILRTLVAQANTAVDNVALHVEAQRLSTTDPLTGLWNFRHLSLALAREIERCVRFRRPLAVLMLDLDHFKAVNDVHGHARGDVVLRELAARVREQIREVDTFARYGGEEFVIVLPETTAEGAAQLAERICDAIRNEPFDAAGEPSLRVTVSVGVASFPRDGNNPAVLMRSADRGLYLAKQSGRDRWQVAPADVRA